MIDGPTLELRGTPRRFVLREAEPNFVGRDMHAHVPLLHDLRIAMRAAAIEKTDGGWIVRVIEGGLRINRKLLEAGERVLKDGDEIQVSPRAILIFHRNAPSPLHSIVSGERWVMFSPWYEFPRIAYAMHLAGGAAITSAVRAIETQIVDRPPLDVDSGYTIVEDIAGLSFSALVQRTRRQGAQLDPRIALGVARAAVEHVDAAGSGSGLMRGALLTWRGTIVWLYEPRGSTDWWHETIAEVLEACGCLVRGSFRSGYARIGAQRSLIDALVIDSDEKQTLRELADTRDGTISEIRAAIVAADERLGPVAPATIASVLAQLYPTERALHERVLEEAGAIGGPEIFLSTRR